MIIYYFKSILRSLKQNGKFTAINIIGFAFGISICLAIVTFLKHEFSYDRYHKNADKIVRLTDTKNNSSSIDYRVKNVLLDNYSEFENGCLVQILSRKIDLIVDGKGFLINGVASVDNNFFDVFTVDFLFGETTSPLPDINSAIITRSAAKTLFGTENALGKEFTFRNDAILKVSGVIEDFPDNSSMKADFLVNSEKYKFSWSCQNSDDLSSYRYPFRIYMQLNDNVNEQQLLTKVNNEIELVQPYTAGIGFLHLKDMYLKDPTTGSRNKKGNLELLKLLSLIAVVILLLAVVNYVNLTVAQQNKRSKNIGIRKTVGAFRSNLLYYFLTESVLVTIISFIFSMFLLWMLIPFYNSIFDTTININELFKFPVLPVIILSVLIIGILSGIGPALVFSGLKPVKIFSGVIKKGKEKGYLRNSLTIFQFTISIALIFGVIIIQRQIFYVKHKDAGFNQDQLVRLKVPWLGEKENKAYTFLNELKKSPFIKQVAVSSGAPGEIGQWMGTNIENSDKNISVASLVVDTAFIETFGLQLIKGRFPQPEDLGKVCLVNESFYNHFEFDNLENKRFNNYQKGGFEIVGVVKDFQISSLHDKIEPVCILIANGYPSSINVKLFAGSIASGMKDINRKWNEILPDQVLEYQFYDEWFNSMYKKEERFAKTISLFAILAIVISCIGILGLATFTAERRIKEIGIRKVNGAKISEILTMLNKDFIKWVVIAFVIATPVAWYAMNKWLENFAYKTNLSWWIFALAGLLALGIALLTVSWQSWRAATRNPVEALRYE